MENDNFFFNSILGYVVITLVSSVFVALIVVYLWAHNRRSHSISKQDELDKEFDWNNDSSRGFLSPIKTYSSRFNNNDLSASLLTSVEEGLVDSERGQNVMPNPIPSPITFRSPMPADTSIDAADEEDEMSTVTSDKTGDSPTKRGGKRGSQRKFGQRRSSRGTNEDGRGSSENKNSDSNANSTRRSKSSKSSSAAKTTLVTDDVTARSAKDVENDLGIGETESGENDTTFQTLFNDQDAFSPYINLSDDNGGLSTQDERVVRYSVGGKQGAHDDILSVPAGDGRDISADGTIDFLDRNSF